MIKSNKVNIMNIKHKIEIMIKSNKVNIMNIKHMSIRYFLNNKKIKKE